MWVWRKVSLFLPPALHLLESLFFLLLLLLLLLFLFSVCLKGNKHGPLVGRWSGGSKQFQILLQEH
jgi:hypothetical protein